MSEQFPPVKAPSAYDGDYKLHVKPRKHLPVFEHVLVIGCLVLSVATTMLFAVAILVWAVTK